MMKVKKTTLHKCRNFVLQFGAIVLMCGIAFTQQYLSHFHNLNPWKGGGFGMFSDILVLDIRVLRIDLTYKEKTGFSKIRVFLDNERTITRKIIQLENFPKKKSLHEFAQLLINKEWYINRHTKRIKIGKISLNEIKNGNKYQKLIVSNLQMKVYEYSFNSEKVTLELNKTPLIEVEVREP